MSTSHNLCSPGRHKNLLDIKARLQFGFRKVFRHFLCSNPKRPGVIVSERFWDNSYWLQFEKGKVGAKMHIKGVLPRNFPSFRFNSDLLTGGGYFCKPKRNKHFESGRRFASSSKKNANNSFDQKGEIPDCHHRGFSDWWFPSWKSSVSQRSDWLREKEKSYLKQIDSQNKPFPCS